MHTMLPRSRFLVCKIILQKWISPTPPTQNLRRKILNFSLRRKELTWKHRGCPRKFQKNMVLVVGLYWFVLYPPRCLETQRKPAKITLTVWMTEAWVAVVRDRRSGCLDKVTMVSSPNKKGLTTLWTVVELCRSLCTGRFLSCTPCTIALHILIWICS